MKFQCNNIVKLTGKLLLVTMLFVMMSTGRVQAQCPGAVDLQAVSIDPSSPTIGIGQTAQIVVSMRNNGPCAIPTGEGTVQVTLSSVYLDLGGAAPHGFADACGPMWSFVTAISNATQHNLFFRNNAGPIPVGGIFCSFSFNVVGKAGTPSPSAITLASSLSAAALSFDVDGSNQSASTVINVAGTPDLTSSQFFTTTQIGAGGIIDEVAVIRNVGSGATTAPIVFSITSYLPLSGLTVTSNAAPSVVIGIDTYILDNSNWTFNPALGTFTSNAGVFIPAGGSRNIGIRITRGTGGSAGANGSVTQTTTITGGTGGGETPTTNNSISNTLLKN